MWLDIAVQLGNLDSKYKRDDIAIDMSPDEIATAQEKVTRWINEYKDLD